MRTTPAAEINQTEAEWKQIPDIRTGHKLRNPNRNWIPQKRKQSRMPNIYIQKRLGHTYRQKMLFYYLLSGVVWWAIYIIGRVEKAYITTAQGILNLRSVSPSRHRALLEKKILGKSRYFLPPVECTCKLRPYFYTFMEPRNRFQGMNSASLCSLAGRYDNPIPTRILAPIYGLKIPALNPSCIFWS